MCLLSATKLTKEFEEQLKTQIIKQVSLSQCRLNLGKKLQKMPDIIKFEVKIKTNKNRYIYFGFESYSKQILKGEIREIIAELNTLGDLSKNLSLDLNILPR